MNKNDIEKLQKDLDTLGEWAVEIGLKINTVKSKAISFTRDRVKNSLGYCLDVIYLLTAIGLSPGGSTHLHTNNT